MAETKIPILFLSIILIFSSPVEKSSSLPLSTKGRWLIDQKTGHRVKLACVNWPSHLETMVAEGLNEQPIRKIVSFIAELKYNCVRFTYATYMWTRYSHLTVSESFDAHNLWEAKAGIHKYNPCFLGKTLVETYESVVNELGKKGIMVLLDNHVSKPSWCCSEHDGNGFFGDLYFDPDEWLLGLIRVAHRFKDKSQVIAMSTRNELRGPKANPRDWYKYIYEGATAIHRTNPNVLIFVSGINFATDLSFLKIKTLGTNYDNKLVYDAHWYAFGGASKSQWEVKFLNEVCHTKTKNVIDKTGFTPTFKVNPVPLFLGEFGVDQSLLSRADDHYLSCLLAYATNYDLDWGIWAWQGSYYLRENQIGKEETFGIMSYHWNRVRNDQLQDRLQIMKRLNIDPSSRYDKSYIMFHPQSGSCVHVDSKKEIYTSTCKSAHHFAYTSNIEYGNPIKLKGTNECIEAIGEGKSPIMSSNCTAKLSHWKLISSTRLHIATTDEGGNRLCLQKESPFTSKIITVKCTLTHNDPVCQKDWQNDPTTQWFKLVRTNVK